MAAGGDDAAAIVAGLILGASATVRQIGEILVLPAVAYLILTVGGGWRQVLRQSAVLVVAFIVPILVYCTGSLYVTGHFWLASQARTSDLGRLAVSADCATLKRLYLRRDVPDPERPGQRRGLAGALQELAAARSGGPARHDQGPDAGRPVRSRRSSTSSRCAC